MLSAVFGIGALVLPVVVPPARRAAGKPAHQYYVEDNAVRLSSFFVFVCRWLALTFFFFWLSLFFCLLLLWRPFSLSLSLAVSTCTRPQRVTSSRTSQTRRRWPSSASTTRTGTRRRRR